MDIEIFYVNLLFLYYMENVIYLLYGYKDDLNSIVLIILFKIL